MEKLIHILIADDDIDDHELFRDAISGMNIEAYNLTQVYNGVETMNYLLKKGRYSNSEQVLPDIIVLDLNMPILDGTGVLREIKAVPELNTIPIFILTTSRSEMDQNKCLKLGAAGYFVKPGSIKELRQAIAAMLSRPHN